MFAFFISALPVKIASGKRFKIDDCIIVSDLGGRNKLFGLGLVLIKTWRRR